MVYMLRLLSHSLVTLVISILFNIVILYYLWYNVNKNYIEIVLKLLTFLYDL